ncbi:MAG: DctP family TRAP transporter solute-binding subunit [Methylovirgula sp.]
MSNLLHVKLPSLPAKILASALIALAFGAGCPRAAAAPKILKFGYILSPNSQLGAGERAFAAEIAARTGGRYVIEDYPNAMLGGEVAMMKDVQLGALDLAFITGAPLPNILPDVGVFNIPFLFRDATAARMVLDGPIGDEYLKKFGTHGLVALAWGENGMRHITNSKRPIRAPDDLVGLKVRLPQSDVMTEGFEALGAKVQQIAFPQVYGALRGGGVDAQENPIATIISAKFYQVQSYLTLTGHVYDPAVVFMSRDAFDALSDADKVAFKEAAKKAAAASRQAASEMERDGVAVLKAHGMRVIEEVDKEAFAKRVALRESAFEKDFGAAVIERIKRAAAEATSATPDKPSQVSQ